MTFNWWQYKPHVSLDVNAAAKTCVSILINRKPDGTVIDIDHRTALPPAASSSP